jgi:hypothetical protein
MDQNFFATLAASLTAGAVTTTGIYTIRRFEAWARQNTTGRRKSSARRSSR